MLLSQLGKGTLLRPGANPEAWVRAAVVWHSLVGVAALAGAWIAYGAFEGWLRWLVAGLFVLFALSSAAAVPLLAKRRHAGRAISLAVNYLGTLAGFLLGMHYMGVYTGFDAFGDTFGRGVPFLGVALLAFLVGSFGDRYEDTKPGLYRTYQRSARIILAVAAAGFLLAVGIIPALLTFLQRLAQPTVAGLFIAGVLFGTFTWAFWRSELGRHFGMTNSQEESLNGYLLLSPNLLGFLGFFAGPLLLSLFVSFTDWDAFGDPTWVGLGNYTDMLGLQFATVGDGQTAGEVLRAGHTQLWQLNLFGQNIVIGATDAAFWISLRNIVVFALLALPLSVVPALFMAALLSSRIPGMKIFRAIYFIPAVAGVVGVALIWRQLFNPTIGFINYFIARATDVLNLLPGVDMDPAQPAWLADGSTALLAVVIVFAWQTVGFNTVLFLAGLQGISRDLYEAATLDGANWWQRLRYITIPQLAPTTFFVVATTGILGLQLFTEPFILYSPESPAGPANSTLTPVIYLYQQGFQRFSLGYASAVAWVLFVLIFVFTLVQFRRERARAAG
jgi:ABC-type sugar transport system permease subunit